jgi:hypothetical protein
LEKGQACGGLKGMENEWLEKRMRADLPFMAHMPYSYGEVGFKVGDKRKNFAAPPSTALSRNHGQAKSTRTWLRIAAHSCMPPSETRIEVPWLPAECRRHRLQSSPAGHGALRCAAPESADPEGSRRPWTS